jgi:hypothetical protein
LSEKYGPEIERVGTATAQVALEWQLWLLPTERNNPVWIRNKIFSQNFPKDSKFMDRCLNHISRSSSKCKSPYFEVSGEKS